MGIDTLVKDIYNLFGDDGFKPGEEDVQAFGHALAQRIAERVEERQSGSALRLSALGTKCDRKLWYSQHTPEKGEPLRPETRIKFLFGDILEELLFFFARCAGHKVEGEQDTVEVEGVKGHRDGVIDGVVVDAKSASTYSFGKFKEGITPDNDAFGYLEQLDAYLEGSQDDPLVVDKERAAFLAIDKQHGHICLDIQKKKNYDYKTLIAKKRENLNRDVPPERGYAAKPDGKSGNMKLGVECSYCAFKDECWPGLRTYLYSTGPRFLTRVVKEPNVYEVKKNG